MAIPFLSGLEIATGTHNEITFTGSGGAKILAPVEMYLDASNDIYLMSHSSVNLTLGNNTATFAGTLSSGTITSTGIVKTSTTFQSTGGSMLFFVPNVGQALEIAQNTGNATFAGDVDVADTLKVNQSYQTSNEYLLIGKNTANDGGIVMSSKSGSSTPTNDWQIINSGSARDLHFYAYGLGDNALILDRETGNATFAGDVNTSGDVHIDEGSASSFQTTNKLRFGHTSWNNNVGLESYWMVLGCNQNEGFKFRDSVSNMLLQLQGGNSTSGNGALSATFAGTITAAGGSSNNNDDANILTLNASEHARLLVDTSSTSGHRATLVLESNSNELTLSNTGSASELTSVGNLTVTSSATTFAGSVTATQFKLNNNVTNTNADSFLVYSDGGSTSYGMTLWNTNATGGEWATMIFGPNQTSRRISFGKANANFGTNHAGIDELAFIDLDNGNFHIDGAFYGDGSNLTGITASNADTVDSLHAASFLRSDAADTATGQLFFDAGFDSHPIMLSGAQNFDNIDRSGFYNLYNTNSGSTSSPGFSFGTMIAIGNDKGSAGFGLQIAHERLGTGMYVRGMNDTASAWSAWAEIWTSTTDGSGSGLDADTVDGIQGASLLRSDADDSYAGNLTVNGMTFKSDSNVSRNFKIQPSSSTTDVGISAFRGDGNHSFQIYGTNTQYGFLDSNWGGWDIRKTKDGALHIDEGSGLNQVLSLGSDGAGSGLDADTVDGIQGASFLRSDAADTASGNLTFTGNIAQTAGVFLSHGDQTGDANTVWQAAGTGKDRGIYPFRYQANASNIPATNDNANWGLNIYSHGGSGGGYPYGIQLAGANASSGENSLFLRTVSNGSFGSWKRVFHEGHLPTMAEAGVTTATVKALGFLRSNADDTASGVITLSNTSTSATLNLSGHAGASNYNYFLKAANDGGNKVVHFVNGSTRTSDGGANTYTIRNDGGSLRLGSSNYTTLLVGSGDLTYNANEVWHAANDGSGSGLDADTVDGIQASSFLQTGGSWNGANMPGSRYAGLAVNGGEIVFQRDNPNNAQMSILVDGAFYAGENNGFYSLYSGNNYNNKIGFYGNSSGHFYINTTSVKANGNTVWHAGNDGSGTGLDADTLDGLHLSNIDNAESYKTWAVSASGGQAVRHTIGRLYGTPAHWDANWQNIEFQITSEYYEATTLKYRLIGNYGGAGTQANMFQLHLLDAQGDLVNNINLTLGTPTDAGWDYSSQDVYYMDLYADVRYYTQFKIHAKTFAHGHATSNPTSGGYHTIFYASPATANISDFSVNHNDPLFRGNKKWHAGNDGSGTGLDADTVDGIQGSAIITTSNIASQNVNSANKIDGIPFLNTGSNSGVNADTMAQNGHVYYTSGVTNFSGNSTDGGIYAQIYNSDWQHQIAGDYRSGQIAIRGKNNGTWQSWYKVWSENNDGSGSGLDADTLDGSQASAFATLSGSNSFTNSYNEFGNNPGAVSNDGTWDGRVNISGTNHARLDLFEDGDDSKLRLYVHVGNNARIDTTSATALQLGTSGTARMTIPASSGVVTTTGQGTLWGSSNDGSGSGLDADTLDGQSGAYYRGGAGLGQGIDYVASSTSTSNRGNHGAGVWAYSGYNTGANRPYTYDATLQVMPTSAIGFELSTSWHSTGEGALKIRALRDCCEGWGSYYDIWSSANDGSGSGLDADTVDGKHKDFLMHYKGTVSGNWDTIFSQTDGHMGVYEVHNISNTDTNFPSGAYTYGGVLSWQLDNSTFKLYAPHTGTLWYQTGWNNDEYSGWRKIWDNGSDGSGSGLDADTLDGYNSSQTGGASKVLVTGSNQYLTLNSWMHVASAGMYSSVNGAHIFPNQTSDYGAWRIQGTRNGWSGITFNSGETTLMASTSVMGFYNDTDNEWMVEASRNGAVSLYYNGAAKISTGSGGVNVTGTVSASADVIAYSDERLKSNIKTLDGSKVYEMRGVSFTKDDKKGSGVIAQELEKIAPELVNNDSEFKAVAYGNITGYLIEAIKDLKQEVEELKKQIK